MNPDPHNIPAAADRLFDPTMEPLLDHALAAPEAPKDLAQRVVAATHDALASREVHAFTTSESIEDSHVGDLEADPMHRKLAAALAPPPHSPALASRVSAVVHRELEESQSPVIGRIGQVGLSRRTVFAVARIAAVVGLAGAVVIAGQWLSEPGRDTPTPGALSRGNDQLSNSDPEVVVASRSPAAELADALQQLSTATELLIAEQDLDLGLDLLFARVELIATSDSAIAMDTQATLEEIELREALDEVDLQNRLMF